MEHNTEPDTDSSKHPPEPSAAAPVAPSGFGSAPAPAGGADLSAELAQALERKSDERIRCTRIGVDTYRCNWWAPESKTGYDNPSMSGLLVTTHRVRQSKFLRATRTAKGLVITVYPLPAVRG